MIGWFLSHSNRIDVTFWSQSCNLVISGEWEFTATVHSCRMFLNNGFISVLKDETGCINSWAWVIFKFHITDNDTLVIITTAIMINDIFYGIDKIVVVLEPMRKVHFFYRWSMHMQNVTFQYSFQSSFPILPAIVWICSSKNGFFQQPIV